jgi:sugar lactone lactonase YvrE
VDIKLKSQQERFHCVAPVGDWCGEGPVWSATQQVLYWVDINRCLVHRLTPSDGNVRTWTFPEPVTALALTQSADTLAVALASKLVIWSPERHSWTETGFRLEGWPDVRLNDGRADPRGSFWVGSMRNNINPDGTSGDVGGTEGSLYRIDPDGRVSIWEQEIGISNTLTWSPDLRKFYFADTLANLVSVFDYDSSNGAIANKKSFLSGFSRGLPDGAVVDCEGYLWNCRVGGSCIVRIAPDGVIDEVVEFPGMNPTSCTFGGENLETLYVTSAALGCSGDPNAGGLFAMDAGVRGLPENQFGVNRT